MGLACVGVNNTAIRISIPNEAFVELAMMLEKTPLTHWNIVSYISLVVGREGTWVGEGVLLDFVLVLVLVFILPGLD